MNCIKKDLIALSFVSVAMLTGCSTSIESANENILGLGKGLVTNLEGPMKKQIDEKVLRNRFVDLSSQKSIKAVLGELEEIDGRMYMLAIGSKNIDIPVNTYFKVKSLDHLNEYMKTTTKYCIEIIKNKYRKDLPKIVRVIHKESIKDNLDKYSIPMEISSTFSTISAKDALVKIAQSIKFSLVFKYTDFPEIKFKANSNIDNAVSVFDNSIINFYGETLFDFISYIEKSYNVFVDVDYSQKEILISKYKTLSKKLELSDLELSSINEGGSGETEVKGKVANTSSLIKLHDEVFNKLEKVFTGSNRNLADKEYFYINKNTGDVLLVASRDKMEKAVQVIDTFNETYSKSVLVDVNVYEVMVYKNNRYGTSISHNTNTSSFSSGSISSFVDFVANRGYESGSNGAIDIGIESVAQYGHIVRGYSTTARLTNNIPKSSLLTTMEEYISSVTESTTIQDGISLTSVSNTTSSLSYGKTITMKPSISDDICTIELDYEAVSQPRLVEKNMGDNTIQLITDSNSNIYRDIVRIKEGEKIVLNSISDYIKVSDYEGIVPVENFIIGGVSDGSYIKKETIYVMSVKKIEKR
jgi:hypothetical protein